MFWSFYDAKNEMNNDVKNNEQIKSDFSIYFEIVFQILNDEKNKNAWNEAMD